MSDLTKPIIDFAERFNTGTNPRSYLKKLIGDKLNLYYDYIIVNDNNIFFLLDEKTKDLIKSYNNIFLDLSQNPLLQETIDCYKTLIVNSAQQLYVVVGDASYTDRLVETNTNVSYFYSSFFHTLYSNGKAQSYDSNPTIKFSSLNALPRIHRIIFINELVRQEMLDKVTISFLYDMQDHQRNYMATKYFQEDVRLHQSEFDFFSSNVLHRCPILLDNDPEYKKVVCDYSINSSAYKDTALNIITETTHDQQFLTEKTWKAIYAKQLFLMLGGVGSVNLLRKFGFDVFDDLIDHSYDNESNLVTRTKMIVNEMKRLEPNILQIHNETRDRRYRNFYHLQSDEFENRVNFIPIK